MSNIVKNHLIIGLGGTGGNILCEMRKRIYEEFRKNTPDKVFIDYLYVDSSPTDLNDRSKWKTMGGLVHLLDAQKVSIHGVSNSVLATPHLFPGIKAFMTPDDIKLLDDLGSLIADGIGGQRRRLGRLLFANNLQGEFQHSFITRLKNSVERMTSDSKDDIVAFHVCAGLAGGTGSGSVIDVVAQIRKEFAPQYGTGDQFKVYLYLYVPETIVATPRHDAGYYQANGYAALLELNAISIEGQYRYRPHDVTGKTTDEKGNVLRLLDGCDAFEAAYLFSNVNEVGRKLEIGTEIPATVADFLYQKIVAATMISQGQMARLSKVENVGTAPERDGAGAPVHSRKFMTFGVKRVEYPETEIREYVTYSFARQAARQMQFNLWRDGIGFDVCTKDEVGMGFKAEIMENKTLEELLLSDNYLTLSKPIVETVSSKKWKEIASGWETSTQFFAEDVLKEKDNKKNWLSDFTKSCELQYNFNYRGLGVNEFYKVQRSEKKAYASFIRRHIEEKLFDEWHTGVKSILEIEKYVSLLIDDCETRLPKFKERIADLENNRDTKTNPEIKKCNKDWNNIGWLTEVVTGASTRVLSAYKTAKCEFYTIQTRIAGFSYAYELLQMIKTELEAMLKNVIAFQALLTNTLKAIDDFAESKCKPQTEEEKNDNKIVKKYDPDFVRETTKRFTMDELQQKRNASQIRLELVNLLGEEGKRSFNNLYEKLDIDSLEDIFINTCIKNATSMMDDLAAADSSQKMLNVNILEKIKQEYNTDERLEEFVRTLYKSAQCYLQFNRVEIGKMIGGENTQMERMIQLCLPEYNDPTNFRKKFIDMFGLIAPGFKEKEDLSVNYKPNQIVVIAAASGFPLRLSANVASLKTKYDAMMIGSKARLNKMALHAETFVKPLPELFEESIIDKQKKLIPELILAYSMGLPVDKEDPVTGETFKAIGFQDELGLIGNWVKLGKNIMQGVELLSADDLGHAKVANLVNDILKSEYVSNEKKKVLKKAIAELINNHLLPLCGNNDMNETFIRYKDAAIKLIQNELAEK